MAGFTVVIAFATVANVVVAGKQWGEMHTGGIDTHHLANSTNSLYEATNKLADAAQRQEIDSNNLVTAAKAEADAMDKLRRAGEAQAKSSGLLADAGRSQAASTKALATVALEAQTPRVNLRTLTITGFTDPPGPDGMVTLTTQYNFTNFGGSTLAEKSMEFDYFWGPALPEVPLHYPLIPGEVPVPPNQGFTTVEPIKWKIPNYAAVMINSGVYRFFVYGHVDWLDLGKAPHTTCFAYDVTIKEGQAKFFVPAGGAAYHCDT